MRKPLLIAAGLLLLVSSAVLADMYQDGSNAKLPAARNNLELGTVKSEGGTPPNTDLVTRFFTFDGTKQFEIASRPNANEYAVEQAGLSAPGGVGVGQGATRICTAPYHNNQVDCIYVADGKLGRHRFANGAGFLVEFNYQGTGPTTAWPSLRASDDEVARLWAVGSVGAGLELKADGNLGKVEISNGNGVIGRFNSAVGGTATAWLKLSGGSDGTARFAADSDTLTNVPLTVFAKGNSPVFIGNSFGSAAEFITSSGAGNNYFLFTAPNGSPPIISNATAGGGIIVKEQRVFTHQALGTSTLPLSDVGQHYHNGGASGVSTYNLPAAANGLNYCFIVKVAQQIVVKAAAGDKIAIAGSNSAAGGQISANAPFASICIEAHEAGQWFAISTPDKTQWTVL